MSIRWGIKNNETNSLDQADREINLFDEFKNILKEESEREAQREGNEGENDSKDCHCSDDDNKFETNSIYKETRLLREIKDICDELNILKTLVEAQDTVWKQAFGIEKLENGPHFEYEHSRTPASVRIKLEYMIHDAQEVQKSVCFSLFCVLEPPLPSLNHWLTLNRRFIPCWTCDKSKLP